VQQQHRHARAGVAAEVDQPWSHRVSPLLPASQSHRTT
jgi:hypothetical protein